MPFQPGNVEGSKGLGSRKPRIVTKQLISLLNEVDTNNVPKVRRFAEALLARAMEGDVAAMNAIMDRVEGKVPQQIQGDPDNPLVIGSVIHQIIRPEPKPLQIVDAGDKAA